jgi:predicted DNA repair protein MutK
LLWLRVDREPAIHTPGASPTAIRTDLILSCSATVIYVAATALTFLSPILALIVFAVLVIGFAVAGPHADAKSRSN